MLLWNHACYVFACRICTRDLNSWDTREYLQLRLSGFPGAALPSWLTCVADVLCPKHGCNGGLSNEVMSCVGAAQNQSNP